MSTQAELIDRRDNQLGPVMRALIVIEKAGNKLPHPFWLFLGLGLIVVVGSAIAWAARLSAVNPATGETVSAVNLLESASLRAIIAGVVENYATFPALGLSLVVLFGVAVAEHSGFFGTIMRAALRSASPRMVTVIVAFVGSASSVAQDAAYMIVIPLGGIAFKAVGRNPVIGCAVAYAATAGGYSAAPFVTGFDAVLGGLTTSAAHIIDPDYTVSPVANLFYNFVSVFVVAAAITLVTELLLNRRGDQIELTGNGDDGSTGTDFESPLSKNEKRGMILGLLTIVALGATLVAMALPSNSFLRDEQGGFGPESGLMLGVAALVGLGFLIIGVVYGVCVGSIKTWADVPLMIEKGVRPFVPVIVLFFAASQFLAVFRMSSLGEIFAIKGADFFESIEANQFVILLGGFVLVGIGALVVTSGSGLWTLLSAVLVPMFMLLDISPETTQALYRVGDSTMNIVSPMSPYFVLVLGFIQKYKKDAGIGTLLSMTIPLSVTMWIMWGGLFFLWWAIGIPWGPGAPIGYTAG